MNHLRVLLIDGDRQQSERISSLLAEANHTVLPADGLEEATEALSLQKFDAVLLGSPLPSDGLAAFAAKVRSFETGPRASNHVPILSLSSNVSDSRGWSMSEDQNLDGYLADPFELSALSQAVMSLAKAVKESNEEPFSDSALFDPEEFKEQVGHDNELMVEIINLYLVERERQVREMREALSNRDWSLLSRIAHTIKGSLGSLHAGKAKSCAQDLELVAKNGDGASCPALLQALEHSLEVLEPHLLALRDAASAS